jgi:hypothetical protein
MARQLKVYQTSQGFYDLTVAAPSMKAALEAWGASTNLFHQGFAKEADDSAAIEAAMAKPGVVLRRAVGSSASFREHADLPTPSSLDAAPKRDKPKSGKAKPKKAAKPRKVDEKAERRAAEAFEKEQQRREKQRKEEEAAAAKLRERRKAAIAKSEAALEEAKRDHEEKAAAIETDLAAVHKRADAEETRWQKVKARLEQAVRKASG